MKYTVVVIAVVSALFFRAFLISVYKVTTVSMEPALVMGDFVLSSQYSYGLRVPWDADIYFQSAPQHGDLVVFSKNYKTFIKRVVGITNDEISYQNAKLTLNSQPCEYLETVAGDGGKVSMTEKCGDRSTAIGFSAEMVDEAHIAKMKLGSGQILVASDNRNTEDAVEIIYIDQIIGKPLFVWMSYGSTQDSISESTGVRWNRILTKLN